MTSSLRSPSVLRVRGTVETLHDLDSYARERLGRRISEAIEKALNV
jgi:hypothetical protein